MKHTEGYFKGVHNHKTYYQGWLPEEEPKAVLLIVHGMGEHSGRYLNVANHFAPRGYAVYAFDLPGHGKTDGTRTYIEHFDDFSDTLRAFYQMVAGWQTGKPVFLLPFCRCWQRLPTARSLLLNGFSNPSWMDIA